MNKLLYGFFTATFIGFGAAIAPYAWAENEAILKAVFWFFMCGGAWSLYFFLNEWR